MGSRKKTKILELICYEFILTCMTHKSMHPFFPCISAAISGPFSPFQSHDTWSNWSPT